MQVQEKQGSGGMSELSIHTLAHGLYTEPYTGLTEPAYPAVTEKPDLRERLLYKGAENLSNRELLAVLLGSGIKGCPVLQLAGRVRFILETESARTVIQKLAAIKGLGTARLAVVLAALELGRRYAGPVKQRIDTAEAVYRLLSRYRDEVQEYFICVMLNGAHDLIAFRVISIGTVNRTLVHPREVFAPAIERRAAAVVLCHNHPSGYAEPSEQDTVLTERMCRAGDLLGLQVLDHLIITATGFYSFAEHRRMPE